MDGVLGSRAALSCLATVLAASVASLAAQTIPELVRARPNTPLVGGMVQDVRPVPLESLSELASVVVIGRLHSPRTYLTPDEMYVLTDYLIQPEQVVAGSFPVTQRVPGQGAIPILAMFGGEMTVAGQKVSMADRKMERPAPGQRFLVFLQSFEAAPGKYQTVYGAIFELQNDRMRSLLKMADGSDPYKDITERSLSSVLPEIARAKR